MGKTSHFKNEKLVAQLRDENLTVSQLSELMEQFIQDTEKGVHVENGWPNSTYCVSKNGLSALTRVWARIWPELQVGHRYLYLFFLMP